MALRALSRCLCIVVMVSAPVGVTAKGAPSMVCGKPSIREHLSRDAKDMNEHMWSRVEATVKTAVENMANLVKQLEEELKEAEAKVAAKAAEKTSTALDDAQMEVLINSAFGEPGWASAAQAKEFCCGACGPLEEMTDEAFEKFDEQTVATLNKFKTEASNTLAGGSQVVGRGAFEQKCSDFFGTDPETDDATCVSVLCDEMVTVTQDMEDVSAGNALGGKTYEQLVQEAKDKREALAQAKSDHEECLESVSVVTDLVQQYTKTDAELKTQNTKCNKANMGLRRQKIILTKLQKQFDDATIVLEEALADEKDAADTLKQWQEHMIKLQIKITYQLKVVSQAETALRRAEAASETVTVFRNKLSTALTGLVKYYDEAIRQPLRNMGLTKDVDIDSLFPTPSETQAAANLRDSLDAVKKFCAEENINFEKLPEVEAEGIKLTAICDSQDWGAVSGEVDTVVTKQRQRSIGNLKKARKKVMPYSGVVADKDLGEVEGVWKAMALFGRTNFATQYLSGWKYSDSIEGRGAKAGFMIELASALEEAVKEAAKAWETAKKALQVLMDEKKNVIQILEVAEKNLQDAITERKEAEVALEKIRAQKELVEKKIVELTDEVAETSAAVQEAKTAMETIQKTAVGSFMEFLHASDRLESESWD